MEEDIKNVKEQLKNATTPEEKRDKLKELYSLISDKNLRTQLLRSGEKLSMNLMNEQEFKDNIGSIGGDGSVREVFSQSTALGMPFSWIIYSPSGSNTYYYITGDSADDIDSTIEHLDAYKKILFDPALFQLVVNTLKREHATQLGSVLSALMQSTAADDNRSKDLLEKAIKRQISVAQQLIVVPSSGGSRRSSMPRKSYPNKSSKLRRKHRRSSSKRHR